jgi:2-aminoadipate transaminase
MSLALANPAAISLAAGFVDAATLPVEEVSAACSRVLCDAEQNRAALQYGPNVGDGQLRQWIAQRNFSERPLDHAHRMILTAGSNQFLQLASESLLDSGDIVLCAAPTYFVYLYILRDLGARPFGVATDHEGLIPAELHATLQSIEEAGDLERVKILYLVPYSDNPAATTMSASRRREILDVLDRWSGRATITLLTDNAYRDLRYEGEDVPSFTDLGADPAWIVETGTFSKNLSPGLRIGWGTAPEPLHTAIERRKAIIDFGSPHFNQKVALAILQSGQFDQHLVQLRAAYKVKRDAMVDACRRYLGGIQGVSFQVPNGGLYVWLTLPESIDAGPKGALWEAAIKAGVLYVPGGFFYPHEGAPTRHNTARLTFGVQPIDRIDAGIRILASVLN